MTPSLTALRERIERIEAEFERQRAGLLRPDGQPRYSDAEHRERLRDLERQRDEQLDAVLEDLARLTEGARREILSIEDGAVTSWLGDEDLAAANLRREFASADVWALSESVLPRRLEAVLASADRPSIFAYWVAARGRADFVQGGPGGDEEGGPSERSARLTDALRDVMDRMRAELLGSEKIARLERARELIEEAAQLELRAGYAREGASGPASAWLNRRVRSA